MHLEAPSRHTAPVAVTLALACVMASLAPRMVRAQDLTETHRIEVARRLTESTVSVSAGSSTGSGFVVGPERWILTNAHVAQEGRGGAGLMVRFSSGTQAIARVLSFDPSHDLALLELQGTVPARPLELGDSDAVQVGQAVLAFGSPFGLDGTLTQGIVSARRDLPSMGGQVRGLIQTDATINPGNSGGPLVNARGEVIGVNTAILSRSGGSQGIGFAVPVSYIRELLTEVRAEITARGTRTQGTSSGAGLAEISEPPPSALQSLPATAPNGGVRGSVWLGILGDDFRSGGYAGVRVQQVVPGSPAEAAGLIGASDPAPGYVQQLGIPWTGHIILGVDGQPVHSMEDLTTLLMTRQPGQRAVLSVTVGPGALNGETTVKLRAPPAQYAPHPQPPRVSRRAPRAHP